MKETRAKIHPEHLSIAMSSNIELAKHVLDRVESFMKEHGLDHNNDIKVVIRELLVNAIMHGNQSNSEKLVYVRITKTGESVVSIQIEDEGPGFNYRSVDMNLPASPLKNSSHGLILVKALSESLEFNSSGNCVTANLSLKKAQAPTGRKEELVPA